jgi:dolichol-phosphate mannosyltransferase
MLGRFCAGRYLFYQMTNICPGLDTAGPESRDCQMMSRLERSMDFAVVVPTYNERENIPLLIARLNQALKGLRWEAIFVDDDSPDGTAEVIANQACLQPNIRLVHRIGRRGLASACIEGMLATQAEFIAVMDGDLQHDETILPALFDRLRSESLDVVIATRNAKSGSMGDFKPLRVLLSQLGQKISKLVCRAQLTDSMSGFFALRRDFLLEVVHDLQGSGFKILVDLLASSRRPVQVAEVGYTFAERKHGQSKLNCTVSIEYLAMVLNQILGRMIPVELTLYCVVGFVGLITYFATSLFLIQATHFKLLEAQAISTFAAMTGNFVLLNRLIFQDRRLRGWRAISGAINFLLICSFGGWANVVLTSALIRGGTSWWLAGLCGILLGSVWNLSIGSQFTWRVRQHRKSRGDAEEPQRMTEIYRRWGRLLQPLRSAWLLLLLWAAVALAITVWVSVAEVGWDTAIYRSAVHTLRAGHDPYATAIALQIRAHQNGGADASSHPLYSYVYPPATLPLLRLIGSLPSAPVKIAYWLLYAAAMLAQLWVAMQAVQQQERRWFLFLLPIAPFFPGLLADGTLLSGNIAFLLYAAVLSAAVLGWRGKSWFPFYAAVLMASFFKAPLLSLVAIAPLSAPRQRTRALSTVAAGIGLIAVQPLLWPSLFRNYLEAVDLQFRFNSDFGCSPAGLLSSLLYSHHLPYSPWALLFYLGYGVPVLATLVYLSRCYFAALFSLKQWIPMVIVGVVLLNPRLIEYDVAPLTLPLALIASRSLSHLQDRARLTWIFAGVLAFMNSLGLYSWSVRKSLDGALLVTFFVVGSWSLLHLKQASVSIRSNSKRISRKEDPIPVLS